jgi:MFS family permease
MLKAKAAALTAQVRDVEEETYRRVTLRIVPFLFFCYLAAYLDRVNVGFAKLQMLKELNFSATVYGFGAGIFFLGYVLFEVPSNIIMHKVGARLWIARIMITWALISGAMAFVTTPMMFYVLRFLLGAAEAGFIPGVLLYLTYWYPANRRGRITVIFLAAIPMSSIFGGPLSGWILNSLSGSHGLSGWQWLFVVETIPSMILGILTLIYLDDRVEHVTWLDAGEKQLIAQNIAREEHEKEDPGESGEFFHPVMRLARNSSSHPAALRLLRKEFLPGALLSKLCAMCLMVVKFAGACSFRTRHSSSRKIMSMTQCRLFSIAQWLRTTGPRRCASITNEVI